MACTSVRHLKEFRLLSCKLSSIYLSRSCSTKAPASALFSKQHEWITVDKSSMVGTVGISNHAQEALGDVVFAQLPDPGMRINAGDECGALESVKAASELYTPVTGEVVEKNSKVESDPGLINKSCYNEGWLFKIKVAEESELKALLNEEQYKDFLKATASK